MEEELHLKCGCGDSQFNDNLIGCDSCDVWEHQICRGFMKPPSEEAEHFCLQCLRLTPDEVETLICCRKVIHHVSKNRHVVVFSKKELMKSIKITEGGFKEVLRELKGFIIWKNYRNKTFTVNFSLLEEMIERYFKDCHGVLIGESGTPHKEPPASHKSAHNPPPLSPSQVSESSEERVEEQAPVDESVHNPPPLSLSQVSESSEEGVDELGIATSYGG